MAAAVAERKAWNMNKTTLQKLVALFACRYSRESCIGSGQPPDGILSPASKPLELTAGRGKKFLPTAPVQFQTALTPGDRMPSAGWPLPMQEFRE